MQPSPATNLDGFQSKAAIHVSVQTCLGLPASGSRSTAIVANSQACFRPNRRQHHTAHIRSDAPSSPPRISATSSLRCRIACWPSYTGPAPADCLRRPERNLSVTAISTPTTLLPRHFAAKIFATTQLESSYSTTTRRPGRVPSQVFLGGALVRTASFSFPFLLVRQCTI